MKIAFIFNKDFLPAVGYPNSQGLTGKNENGKDVILIGYNSLVQGYEALNANTYTTTADIRKHYSDYRPER